MRVGIVGYGHVGQAVERAVRPVHECTIYDTREVDVPTHAQGDVNRCDLAFVCVPTPSGPDGRLDVSAVEEVLSWLRTPLRVVRSTMPACVPDYDWTGRKLLPVVYQPEFIGASPWAPWREERDCSMVVAGSLHAAGAAQQVLDFWKPILGPEKRYIATSWQTAAEIKFAINCHGAVKAAWWHEYLGQCARPDEVRNAVMNVPWVGNYHTLPLGGVGGTCLPKDLKAWVSTHGGPIAKAALEYMNADRPDAP